MAAVRPVLIRVRTTIDKAFKCLPSEFKKQFAEIRKQIDELTKAKKAPVGRTPFPAQLQPVRDTINQVLKGQKPLSALTAEQRRLAAEFYRKTAGEVGGKFKDQARQFNLERARFLEDGGNVPPGSLPEFMQRPQ
jgi:hypothetical protein